MGAQAISAQGILCTCPRGPLTFVYYCAFNPSVTMTALTVQMEAYAFRQLVDHLQWRTDVANIDLMNLAGFCRNCLSKWYHAGSKLYGLPMEYDEACERIYGEPYGEWKKKHNKPATDEQMKTFKSGGALHAKTEPKGVAPVGLV